MEEGADTRDWSELPLDALSSVFAKLGAVEILMGAGLACHSWLDAAKVPSLWRFVDMAHHKLVDENEMDQDLLCAMAKVAVDRSEGQLEVFLGKCFVTDELLVYIGDRSPCLKGLGLMSCWGVSNLGFTKLVTKSPLLEDLLLSLCHNIDGCDVYEATGKACTQLKRFSLRGWNFYNKSRLVGEGFGIAAMHGLRDLRLIQTEITNEELAEIIDGCPHLEHLFLSHCYNILVDDALKAKCAGIKEVRFPCVSLAADSDEEEFVATDCARDFDYGSD